MPKRKPAKKIEAKPCAHPREIPMPVFAQKPASCKREPDGSLTWNVITCVMQLWGCPDCLKMYWRPLPFITGKEDGELFPTNAGDYVNGQADAYLASGESAGRRREMWRKLMNKREAEAAKTKEAKS